MIWQKQYGMSGAVARLQMLIGPLVSLLLGSWLAAAELSDADVRVLIVLLQKGNRAIRKAADGTLMVVSQLSLDPVGGTEIEGADRAKRYERWLATRER